MPLGGIRHFLASHTAMSSSTQQQNQGIQGLPPNLRGEQHEMRDYYADHPDVVPPPTTTQYYTPYLGLRARLSQTWINRWTILILLVIFRIVFTINTLNKDLASAKSEALSACSGVENVGSAMASMPHYLAAGVNSVAADGITKAVSGLMDMLMLSVTAVEEIILFVINMYTSTYVCLITLAITGSLEVAIAMIEGAAKLMNESISTITGDMSSVVGTFEKDFNKFLSAIDIGGIFGKTPPSINLTGEITALNSITIDPTTLDSDLQKLNDSLPSFAQVQNFTNTVIELPFEEVKKLLNESVSKYVFDHSIFPVPEKKALTFCSNGSTVDDFFTDVVGAVYVARKVFIIVLSILAVLVCIPMAYREIWQWRTSNSRATLLQKHAFNPMDVLYIAARPYTSTAGIKVAARFQSSKRQILARWFVAYSTTLPALFVLVLGLTGLFSCLCQYIVLLVIKREVPALAQAIGDFTAEVVTTLENESLSWANGANAVINSTNTKINSDVFGWVNTTTSAVNNTLNVFVDDMSDALNVTFGGTLLYKPIQEVINCLIGLKIAGIEKGLTWVSDNAKITLPEFSTDIFSSGAAASIGNSSDSFLSSPGSVTTDDVTAALVTVTNALQDSINTELFIACILLALFFFNMLIGATRVAISMWGRDKTRAEGGPRPYVADMPLSPRAMQQRNDAGLRPQFGGVTPVDEEAGGMREASLGDNPFESENEKMGRVDQQGARVQGHQRTSSYGLPGWAEDRKI